MATRRRPFRTANDAILDRAIVRAHDLERYKNGTVRKILGRLNRDTYPKILDEVAKLDKLDVETWGQVPRWGHPEMRKLQTRLRTLVTKGIRSVERELNGELDGLARAEARWQFQAIQDATPVRVSMTMPSPTVLQAVRTKRPFQGRLLKDWYGTLDESLQTAVRSTISNGISQGQSIPDIVRSLRGTDAAGFRDGILQTSRRHAEAVARTATSHVASGAREELYRANSDVIKGVRFVATLDSRTTIECASLDGQVFDPGEGPRPPIHYSCRSTTSPVLKSFEELGIPIKERKREGVRLAMDGKVPKKTTYGDWLKTQDASVQARVLGKKRAELFRGGTPIDRFTNNRNEVLTLDQLAKREGIDG